MLALILSAVWIGWDPFNATQLGLQTWSAGIAAWWGFDTPIE